MKVLLLWLCLLTVAWAAPADTALKQRHWSEAVPLLLEEQRNGRDDGRLWYNLGLCYQRLGDPGRARAAYESALRRWPWSTTLQNNLALLKSKLVETEPDETWAEAAQHCAPPEVLALVFLLSSWAGCALALQYRRRPRERWLWTALACCLLALASGTLWGVGHWRPRNAAVLPETAVLKNGPGAEFTDSISLHSGNLVQIEGEQGDWVEVAALGKVNGWMRRDELQWVQ